MLFHSPMSRMKKTRPEVLEGERDPKTASWRSHHGAITSTNKPTQAMAAATGMAGRARLSGVGGTAPSEGAARLARQARQRSQTKARPRAASTSRPSLRDSVATPGEQPGQREGSGRAPEAASAHPQRGRDQRLVQREVVRLRHVGQRQDRDRDEEPGADRDRAARAGVAGDRPGERSGGGADQREGQGRGPGDVTEQHQERHLDQRRQWHPVGVRRDRQDRLGRQDPADLGEDPDEVDVESLARGKRSGDIDVIERIGVRRVRKVPEEDQTDGEGEPVQEDGDTHGRCSVAPGPGPARPVRMA